MNAATASGSAFFRQRAALTRPPVAPRRLAYEPGQPIPDGYRLRRGPHRGLVIAGSIVGGGAYAFGVMGAIDTGLADNSAYLFVPIAGPWLMLAAGSDPEQPCSDEPCVTGSPSYKKLFVGAAGVAQALGVVFLVTGLTADRPYLERKTATITIVPALAEHGYGLSAVGTF